MINSVTNGTDGYDNGFNYYEIPKDKCMYIYCRVSTKYQDDNGVSLEVQRDRGLEVSKKLGLEPIVIMEQGSGLKPYKSERPKFSKLMEGVEDGMVENIWIDELTRKSRNDVDLPYIQLEMKKNGINLYVGSEGKIKEWGFETKVLDTLITMVNQNQIEKQVRKSIRSKRRLFQEGCYMKGDPPFGYELVDKKLVINQEESEWVKNMFEWYNNGTSTWVIQSELFTNGMKPRRSKTGMFPMGTIVKMLQNENYIGIDIYRDLKGECPPIVDKKLFYSVQDKFLSMRKIKEVKNKFLLRGILRCSDGLPTTCLGVNKTRKHPLYSCNHRKLKQQRRRTTNEDCNFIKSIRMESLDFHIWDTLCNTLFNSVHIKEKIRQELVGNKSSYTIRSFNKKMKTNSKKINDLEDKRIELEKRYYIGKIEKKRFDILNKHIQTEIDKYMKQIGELEMKIGSYRERNKWIDWMEEHKKRIDNMRDITDFDERRKLIQHYIHSIHILDYDRDTKQHTITIKFQLPLFDDKFEWVKNQDGTFKVDKNGKRKFNILEGDCDMNYQKTLPKLLNGNGVVKGVFFHKPYLTLDFVVISHKFSPNQFVYRNYKERQPIHKRINQLTKQGLGYKRIHRVLTSEGFDIGNSPTCVDTMIKKIKKRKSILSQKTTTEFKNIGIEIFRT